MGTKVTGASRTAGGGVEVTMESKGKTSTQECDVLLVSIGRRPYTANVGLEVRGWGRGGGCSIHTQPCAECWSDD